MRREFLKNLGIEDKDIIDKIMDENSADIGRAKGELETYKNKVTELEGKLTTKDGEIATLTKKVGDTDALNSQIAQLTTDKTNLTNELNTKISQMQKTYETENKVRDRKAKNVKAVMALLDPDKDVDEQLDALVSGEDTSFLFGESINLPAGTHLSNPPTGGNGGNPPTSKTFAEAVAKALTPNK